MENRARYTFRTTSIVATLLLSGAVNATLTLTPAATTAGWNLTPFAIGFPYRPSGSGPLGIAFLDNGKTLISDAYGNIRAYASNLDSQVLPTPSASFGEVNGVGNSISMARVGSRLFLAEMAAGKIIELNSALAPVQDIVTGLSLLGMVVNPSNGHLLVGGGTNLKDVDPVAKFSVSLKAVASDGVATDGVTAYYESNRHIYGLRLADKATTFDSGFILGSDGIVMGSGALANNLFVNTNNGQLFQVNLSTKVITLLATAGNRGDFCSIAPDGTVLVTQSDAVFRLTPPPGKSFLGVYSSPSTVSVKGGSNLSIKVSLGAAAPATIKVLVNSSNAALTVPTSLTFPAGSKNLTLVAHSTAVSTSTNATVQLTLNGTTATTVVTLTP